MAGGYCCARSVTKLLVHPSRWGLESTPCFLWHFDIPGLRTRVVFYVPVILNHCSSGFACFLFGLLGDDLTCLAFIIKIVVTWLRYGGALVEPVSWGRLCFHWLLRWNSGYLLSLFSSTGFAKCRCTRCSGSCLRQLGLCYVDSASDIPLYD